MLNEFKEIVTITGIVGVVASAVLTSWGYFYKSRVEDRKYARKVLYFLLEIRITILNSVFDPQKATEIYKKKFCENFEREGIKLDPDSLNEMLFPMVQSHFIDLSQTIKTDVKSQLLIPYEEALLDLATINPVFAYTLKGREKYEELLLKTESYLNRVNDSLIAQVEQEGVKEALSLFSENVNDEVQTELLINGLEEEILKLAKYCSKSDYKNCLNLIEKGKNINNLYDFSEIEENMSPFIESLKDSVLSAKQDTTLYKT